MDRIFDAYVEAGHVPLVQIGFTPKALSDYDGPYQHSWTAGAQDHAHPHRLGVAAQRSGEMGRPGRGLGAASGRSLRRRQGLGLAVGSLERARRQLLAGDDPAVLRDVRCQRPRGEARAAKGPCRRTAYLRRLRQREGPHLPARLPQACRRQRLADRFSRLPCQGQSGDPRRSRADGPAQAAARHRNQPGDHQRVSDARPICPS